jgi:hypothetical protein
MNDHPKDPTDFSRFTSRGRRQHIVAVAANHIGRLTPSSFENLPVFLGNAGPRCLVRFLQRHGHVPLRVQEQRHVDESIANGNGFDMNLLDHKKSAAAVPDSTRCESR